MCTPRGLADCDWRAHFRLRRWCPADILHVARLQAGRERTTTNLNQGVVTYSRSGPVPDDPDPLAASGVDVDGIDISANAIEHIQAHPWGGAVNAGVADISDFALDRKCRLIYCVSNSLFNVGQDSQIRCFELVAEHLTPDGLFLIDSGYTPRWFETLRNSQYVEARHFELNFASLQALRVDPIEQLVYQQNIYLSKDRTVFSPCVHRYSSLGELDLMARIAGLQRRNLWGGRTRDPYGADSTRLVATYGPR